MVPLTYVYLLALIPLVVVWILLYFSRRDLRKEMLVMSFAMAFGSFITSYFWWTRDWWRPPTITGTRAGIEDVILGFAVGGILAITYEVLLHKQYWKKRLHHHASNGVLLLLLLANIICWGTYVAHLTTFWSSSIALVCVSIIVFYFRTDLILNGVLTGIAAVAASLLSYATILVLNTSWFSITYLPTLSGITFVHIPIEELAFWFLAGMFFGPFYEYCLGIRLKK